MPSRTDASARLDAVGLTRAQSAAVEEMEARAACEGLGLARWAALLVRLAPRAFRSPARLGSPATSSSWRHRVAVLARRQAAGMKLWNPLDVVLLPPRLQSHREARVRGGAGLNGPRRRFIPPPS